MLPLSTTAPNLPAVVTNSAFVPSNVPILLQGSQISAEVSALSNLLGSAFDGYPCLYEKAKPGDNEAYIEQRYVQYRESVVFITYRDSKVVGAAMGVPLDKAPPHYLEPFKKGALPPLSECFYFGELMVLPEYQKQKIGHDLYAAMGNFVKNSPYKAVCFATIDRTPADPLYARKPEGYVDLADILGKKHGFTKREDLRFVGRWPIHGETVDRAHPMVYWWRKITHADRERGERGQERCHA